MAGQITAATLDSGAASTAPVFSANGTQIGSLCRAWVSFTGAAGAIRASFNVGSVTRNATGDYTLNFTNSMPDANYSACITSTVNWGGGWPTNGFTMAPGSSTNVAPTASGFRFATANTSTAVDSPYVNVSVFR